MSAERCPTCGREADNRQPLTARQSRVLRFIEWYARVHGHPPTFQVIADSLGYRSLATVHEHVTHIREKGYLAGTERYGQYRIKVIA